jgi:proline iminopeptidase
MNTDEFTNQELMLDVGDGHALYIHDWGNPKAKTPIVILHGGPGGGFSDRHKQRFDPTKQRVIFHDQRGAGKSTPYGSLENNTTNHLVEDIEKIATHLNLKKFILTGGSWGSTLALLYALKYPSRVKTLILQGIYTASKQEFSYVSNGLYRTHFPEVWQRLLKNTPSEFHDNPTGYHIDRMFGANEGESQKSAQIYTEHETALLRLDDRFTPGTSEDFDPIPAKIMAYYIDKNDCFLSEDRYILNNAHKIKIPTYIVQGRYDFVCPPITAYELSNTIPNASLIWTQAGHVNDRSNYEVMKTLLLQSSQE